MDIIVTTPKSEMSNAAQEAEDTKRAGGGHYFRRFSHWQKPNVEKGNRVYYVEDGYVRGFCEVSQTETRAPTSCTTTGREWPPGFYVFMDSKTWQWINPVPMRGFQGFRYANMNRDAWCQIVGGWLDPKPEVV